MIVSNRKISELQIRLIQEVFIGWSLTVMIKILCLNLSRLWFTITLLNIRCCCEVFCRYD